MNMKLKFAAVAAVAVLSSSAMAAGFLNGEQSALGTGRAYAGAGVMGDDLSTVFANPAGMTALSGTRAQAGFHVFGTSFKFKGENGIKENGRDKEASVPGLFFTHQLNNDIWFGLGITAPYALSTSYNRGWAHAARGDYAKIETIDINPSLAWKVSDQISVGAGVSAQYAHAKLGMALATDAQTSATGMHGFLDVDGWKFGFNVGATYEPNETMKFGLAYRSAMSHKADGDFKVDGLGGTVDFVTDSTARLKTPATLAFSSAWKFAPQWTLSTIVRYSKWSNLKNITIANKKETVAKGLTTPESAQKLATLVTPAVYAAVAQQVGMPVQSVTTLMQVAQTNPSLLSPQQLALAGQIATVAQTTVMEKGAEAVKHVTDVTINSNFKDTWLVGVGLDYEVNNDWTVRGGVAFESNPLKKQQDRLAVLPDSKRLWLTTGLSYKPAKNIQVDAALVYLKALGTSELYSYQHNGQRVGKFSSHSVFGGLQVQYQF